MVILIFYFIIGYLSCFFSLTDTLGLASGVEGLEGWLLVFTTGYLCVYLLRKWVKAVVPAICILLLIWVYSNLDVLREGALSLMRMINSVVLQYTGVSDGLQELALQAERPVGIFLMLFFFLWGTVLFYGIFVKGGKMITAINLVIPVGAALAVGKVPKLTFVCMLALCCIGTFAASGIRENKVRAKAAFLTGVIGVLCLLAGKLAVEPILSPAFSGRKEVQERIQNTSLLQELLTHLPEVTGGFFSKGGMGKGDLSGADAFLYSGKTALNVHAEEKPEETIYLKGFTGTEYTGKRWVPLDDPQEEITDRYSYQYAQALVTQLHGEPSSQLGVQNVSGEEELEFQPYFSQLDMMEEEENLYSYYPLARISRIEDEQGGYYLSTESNLMSRELLEKYLEYPAEELPGLRQVVDENPVSGVLEAADVIQSFLSGQCSYNLQAGRFPAGEEFTEYFVFEKKEGYCVHFATAAVLMLRMYGYPARYAEGYIAPAKDFKKDESGYLAKVTDERAHAWAEVYSAPKGWIPVEATPGFSQSGQSEQESEGQKQSESRTAENQPLNQKPQKDKTNGSKKAGEDHIGAAVWTAAAAVLLTGMAVLCLRREWLLKKRRKAGARELFPDLYRVLIRGGWEESTDCQNPQFAAKLSERFPWLPEKEFGEVMDIVMRANYSDQPPTAEEERKAQEMYRTVCSEVTAGLSSWKKIRFRYLDGL